MYLTEINVTCATSEHYRNHMAEDRACVDNDTSNLETSTSLIQGVLGPLGSMRFV
jgi:hypothetical protein